MAVTAERVGPSDVSYQEPRKGPRRIFRGAVASTAAVAVFAGLPISLKADVSDSTISPQLRQTVWTLTHQSLPNNPFTQLPSLAPPSGDITPQQIDIAERALSLEEKGTIVVIDGVGFGEKIDNEIAAETQQFDGQLSEGSLRQKVIVEPASPETKETLAALEPLGTQKNPAPVPPAYLSPAAIALATMPNLREEYPDAIFVYLSPQVAGDSSKKIISGIAYTGNHIATVYENKKTPPINSVLLIVHEGSGHEEGLGHKGAALFVPAQVKDNSITLNLRDTTYKDTISKKGKLGNVIQKTVYGKPGSYQEYADDSSGDPMGVGDAYGATSVNEDGATFSPREVDLLNLPKALLLRNKNGVQRILHERFIGNEWTTISSKDINNGDYAMMSLIKPVTLQGAWGGSTTFDTFAIDFEYVPQDMLARLGGRYMTFTLYDAKGTHNEATGQQIFLKDNTSFTIRIENGGTVQDVQLISTPNGISLCTGPETKIPPSQFVLAS